MMTDLLFAALAVVIGVAAAMMFYGAGFVAGHDKGRAYERKVLSFFQKRGTHAQTGLN